MLRKYKKNVYIIIDEVKAETNIKKKIEILRLNSSSALLDILRGTYDKSIKFCVDPNPNYRPLPENQHAQNLLILHREFKYFSENKKYATLRQPKRESMFLAHLELIHHRDAELVLNMVRKQGISGVSRKVVERAFPNLLVDPSDGVRGKKPSKPAGETDE